jgi:WXG100 family type VII secretion target
MANYSINPAVAQQIVQDIITESGRLETSLSNLEAAVQRFTAANNGQAPDAYAGAQRQWSLGQTQMRQALSSGGLRLQDITDNYVNGDRRGAAVFS